MRDPVVYACKDCEKHVTVIQHNILAARRLCASCYTRVYGRPAFADSRRVVCRCCNAVQEIRRGGDRCDDCVTTSWMTTTYIDDLVAFAEYTRELAT